MSYPSRSLIITYSLGAEGFGEAGGGVPDVFTAVSWVAAPPSSAGNSLPDND